MRGSSPSTLTLESALPDRSGYRVVVGDGEAARVVDVREDPVHVGSDRRCGIVVDDAAVSRFHCRLDPAGAHLVVRDLRSRNGTWVAGARVAVAHVGAGARLRVGRTALQIVGAEARERHDDFIAASPSMITTVAQAHEFARLDWPVLIEGESGAGKEGIATLLHRAGPRARGPFVAVNAAAIAPGFVESELFGHNRGAFTGALSAHRGVFEQASGGTLFLDEVGELALAAQARLLRVIETKCVRPIGAEADRIVDARVVCATHRDLGASVEAGAFRSDLYFRLARLVISVPPLRERPEDVLALTEHFLAAISDEVGPRTLAPGVRERLLTYGWPGNARELRNALELASVRSTDTVIRPEDLLAALAPANRALREPPGEPPAPVPAATLRSVLDLHRGNVSAAARALGVARSTLRDRLGERR